jgi:acyl dehydratase
LPAEGTVSATVRILDVFDKGVGRGAVLYVQTSLIDPADGAALATLHSTIFARGDGGFGGPPGNPPPLEAVPERTPDITNVYKTAPGQALLYRLLGDRNPLHSDPDFARRVGFDRPILHGLCTYGIAVRALVKDMCGHDPARIAHLEARFTAPVFPGEEILTEMWRTDEGGAFRALVPGRGTVVLDRGKVLWRD